MTAVNNSAERTTTGLAGQERRGGDTISVVINTYNASRHLHRVLDTVQDFDEVLVCDMESTDNTVEIARSRGCRVVTFGRGEHRIVEPARNFALQQATGRWVLVVDADELVPQGLAPYLYRLIGRPDCPAGLYLPRRNFFMGRFMHGSYPDHILRFMKREGTVWPEQIHAQPAVDGPTATIPARRTDLALIHLANETWAERIDKINTYTDLEVPRRSHKRYGLGALLTRPLFRFLKAYVIKGGFRDGLPGLIDAANLAYYQFVMVGKIIELRKRKEI